MEQFPKEKKNFDNGDININDVDPSSKGLDYKCKFCEHGKIKQG